MYDFFEFGPIDKKTAAGVLIVFILLVVTGGIGYMLGLRHAGAGVPDNGNGAGHVGEQLSTAIQHQHEITGGLNEAVTGSHAAAAAAEHIAETAGAAAAEVAEAGRLINQCQQIIGTVRNRGKKDPAAR